MHTLTISSQIIEGVCHLTLSPKRTQTAVILFTPHSLILKEVDCVSLQMGIPEHPDVFFETRRKPGMTSMIVVARKPAIAVIPGVEPSQVSAPAVVKLSPGEWLGKPASSVTIPVGRYELQIKTPDSAPSGQ
jgi:hypothetical protein